MKKLTAKQMARIIERHVSYFNGWAVSYETMKKNCLEAAEKILKALSKRGFSQGSKEAR